MANQIFGFGTNSQMASKFSKLDQLAVQVEALQINKQEMVKAIQDVNNRLHKQELHLDGVKLAIAAISFEQDLKAQARHIQAVQISNLQKYANIFVAGASNKVSPYALTQRELDKLADTFRRKDGINIMRSLNKIDMNIAIINNELKFYFSIPIIEEDLLFHLYKVTPIPVFTDNKTYVPDIDATNIAISQSGADYITLTDEEYRICTEHNERCKTASLTSPISSSSSCVLSTYTGNILKCPLKETTLIPSPFFLIKENSTIYSLPQETRIYIKCKHYQEFEKYADETITISGIGEASFKPGCSITLPNGSKFKTPINRMTEKMENSKIFEILRIYPIPTDVKIQKLTSNEYVPVPELSFTDVTLPTWNNLAIETFHPHNIIPFVMRVIFTIIVLVIIILVCIVCNPSMKKKFHDWRHENDPAPEEAEEDPYSSMDMDTIPPPRPRKNTISNFINKSLESLHLKPASNQEPTTATSRPHLAPCVQNNEYVNFPTPAQQQYIRRKSLGHINSNNFVKPAQEKRRSVNFENRHQTSV